MILSAAEPLGMCDCGFVLTKDEALGCQEATVCDSLRGEDL